MAKSKKRDRPKKRKVSEETREKMRQAYRKRMELKENEAKEEIKNQSFDSNRDIREQLADYVGLPR